MAAAFEKILCPVDLNPVSLSALHLARRIAVASKGQIVVLYVVPIPIEALGAPITLEPYAIPEQKAKAQLELEVPALLGSDVSHEIVIRTGDPVVQILSAEKEFSVDLVVMATHGRRGLGHFFLGSVAERVVRESPSPVLTIRPSVPR